MVQKIYSNNFLLYILKIFKYIYSYNFTEILNSTNYIGQNNWYNSWRVFIAKSVDSNNYLLWTEKIKHTTLSLCTINICVENMMIRHAFYYWNTHYNSKSSNIKQNCMDVLQLLESTRWIHIEIMLLRIVLLIERKGKQ